MNRITQRESNKCRLAACLAFSLLMEIVAFGQSPMKFFEVSGTVFDPSGAVLTEAKVTLRNLASRAEQSKTTDRRGQFRFSRLAIGDYEVEAHKEGFKPTVTQVKLSATTPAALQIVLPIADLHADTAVVDGANRVSTNPDDNLNVIKLDRDTLRKLPALGNDVIGSLANMLDAGSVGSGGATVIVDGLESKKKKIPASQIQEVRINQNPYSAEFSRPGRGRIEVITKAGSPEYHGEFSFTFRDHHLDARNAFATTRPPEQRRIYDGNLSGPIGNGKKTSFIFGVACEEENLQSVVFAITPAGIISQNVAYPNRDTELFFRINHQVGDKTTLSIRYEHTFDSTGNGGVGGFNLPEVATNSSGRDHELYFTFRRILSPKLINEFTLRASSESGSTRGEWLGAPRIVVLDAFTGGGSQVDRHSTETQFQLNEILSWNQGKHFVKGGVNIPDITRRGSSDRSNFGGTFSFSTLEDYLSNRPFLFSINQGDGHLVFWQRDFGAFVQDNILLRPNFSIGAGLRYDWQNYLGDGDNFAPRVTFAYAPGKQRKTVIRGGAGVFYDRTGGNPISDTLRFDGQRLRQVTLSNSGYPDPLSTGGTLAAKPGNVVRFAPGIRSPYTIQSSLGVERQLTKSLTVAANYINTRGLKLFRSRNLNAPFPPSSDPPNSSLGVFRQLESSARLQSHAMELVFRGKIARYFNGTVQYTLGRADNNAGGINALPANNYDLSLEWSRAEFDERHRFNLLGSIEAGDWFNLGLTLSLTSGAPYNLTTGRDDNHDTVANDRPSGVRRNSLQATGAATLNLRWSKEFELKKAGNSEPTVTIGVDAFNVFNRTNFTGYVGNLSSPFFGLPVAARPARRMQLSFGFVF